MQPTEIFQMKYILVVEQDQKHFRTYFLRGQRKTYIFRIIIKFQIVCQIVTDLCNNVTNSG